MLGGIIVAAPQQLYSQQKIEYSVASPIKIWHDELGNHRAVLEVTEPAHAVELDIEWRRHDLNPEKRRFIIMNAQNGQIVKNVLRKEVNNERCKVVFGPVNQATEYYLYYLPYPVNIGHGSFGADYLSPEPAPDAEWVAKIEGEVPKAKLQKLEARTQFDSFYPMEVVALKSEVADYKSKNASKMLLFPEDRQFPIRMKDAVPQKWLDVKQGSTFAGKADMNEYYAYQVGVWAAGGELKNLKVEWSDLKSNGATIEKKDITCFNTEGYNPSGKYFTKNISVKADNVQPLWFGVDIAQDAKPGVYKGSVSIAADGVAAQSVAVEITVSSNRLADRGDSELWKHSRLRWLNSRAGISNEPTKGYDKIKIEGEKLIVTGREITLAANALPKSIKAGAHEILSSPVEFVVSTDKGNVTLKGGKPEYTLKDNGRVEWTYKAANSELELSCKAALEFDGWVNYVYTVKPLVDIKIKDIVLNIPMRGEIAQYMMGMGLEGGHVPTSHSSKWHGVKTDQKIISTTSDAPVKLDGPMDSFWIGNAKGGIHCELRGASYTGPLLNLYQPKPPVSWNNDGKGGFMVKKSGSKVVASAYSGQRELKAGEQMTFDFAMIVTPVKPINYQSQFTDRYYHKGSAPTPRQEDVDAGVKVINVHHANELNPYINYPFLTTDKIKDFTDTWHKKGMKVKFYYTIRELTNNVPEIWALRSLGDEILGSGSGGGYPWLREHLVTDYHPQWYQYLGPVMSADASIVNSPGESRWYNYYVEGLGWLVRNLGIDGIYLDDVTYGRDMLKRMRRVMDVESDNCIIDLHSNTGFSRGAAIQYAEFFPYVDKLWFGESFYYNRMSPENWLVEVSGIPYGLMSDMLHRGGNRWRGMVYGMTVRHPWMTDGVICDPRPIWKIWDSFGIADSKMIGYWEDKTPVTTSNDKVLATTYLNKRGEVLVAVASWDEKPADFTLKIDWKALGLDPKKVKIYQPAVDEFQGEATYLIGDKIKVEPTKGYMFVLSTIVR